MAIFTTTQISRWPILEPRTYLANATTCYTFVGTSAAKYRCSMHGTVLPYYEGLVQHLSNPAYNAWMVSSTSGIIKINFYSMRDLVFMPVYTVFMLFSGILIDYTEKNNNLKFGFEIFGVIVLLFFPYKSPIHS